MTYLVLLAIVFLLNLIPAFAPPTWTVLATAVFHSHLSPVPVVILGLCGATAGRAVLALTIRRTGHFLPQRFRDNVAALQARLQRRRRARATLVGLFVVSPLPSAQLFCAAGLVETPLLPLLGAFALGRTVTYSVSVATASATASRIASLPPGWRWGLEVGLTLGVVAVPMIPWRSHAATDRAHERLGGGRTKTQEEGGLGEL